MAFTYEEPCPLATWQYLLVPGAGIQHPLQLQLAELAMIHHLTRQSIPQRVR
jgi:hypothetical protein